MPALFRFMTSDPAWVLCPPGEHKNSRMPNLLLPAAGRLILRDGFRKKIKIVCTHMGALSV